MSAPTPAVCNGGDTSRDASSRYRAALELYRTSDLPVKVICGQTGVPVTAFRAYVRRSHRELMFARHGIVMTPEEARVALLRKPRGQSETTHAKYKDAIEACGKESYLQCNVSQIANMFGVAPSSLSQQLRKYYPEIIDWRERERCLRGCGDNRQRGARACSLKQYAEAVKHLLSTNETVRKTAAMFNVSYTGLREHLLLYHKELLERRSIIRIKARGCKIPGSLTGNGTIHMASADQNKKYEEAVNLYRTTALTLKEIAASTGVAPEGLGNYLRVWHRDLILQHRGIIVKYTRRHSLSEIKRYRKSSAEKYAGAIELLKTTGASMAAVAQELGLNPEVFREYLHEHEPELAAKFGMTRNSDGKLISVRSMDKYKEAIEAYETTTEPLKEISARLGLKYNSVGGFVRRNRPDAIRSHKRLVEEEERRRRKISEAEKVVKALHKEEEEKERIAGALRQSGYNRTLAARLLCISKTTLYNKIKSFAINIPIH